MAINFTPQKSSGILQSINPVKSTQTTIFEAVLIVIILAVSYPYLIKPKQQELHNADLQLKAAIKDRDQFEQTKKDLDNLKKVLTRAENEPKIDVLDEALPLQTRITHTGMLLSDLINRSALTPSDPVNIATIDQTADTAGVFLGKQSEFALNRKVEAIHIVLRVTGSMDNFSGFLQLLEKENRIFDIQTLDITPEKEGVLSFRMTMNSYLYAPVK